MLLASQGGFRFGRRDDLGNRSNAYQQLLFVNIVLIQRKLTSNCSHIKCRDAVFKLKCRLWKTKQRCFYVNGKKFKEESQANTNVPYREKIKYRRIKEKHCWNRYIKENTLCYQTCSNILWKLSFRTLLCFFFFCLHNWKLCIFLGQGKEDMFTTSEAQSFAVW